MVAAGGVRVRRRQRRAHVQPGGAHQVRRRERRDRDARQPAAGRGRGVPRRAVRLAAGRLAAVHAAGHRVAVVGRQGGRPVRAGVPATVARRVQRDGRAEDDGPRPHAVPAPPVAVPAEPERGLPVPEHLRAGTRSVDPGTKWGEGVHLSEGDECCGEGGERSVKGRCRLVEPGLIRTCSVA